jgi:hypothetical protein
MQRPTCCAAHGDDCCNPPLNQTIPHVTGVQIDNGFVVRVDRLAATRGIRKLVAERTAVIAKAGANANMTEMLSVGKGAICRLHIAGRCRYAEDCNFIHVCRNVTDEVGADEIFNGTGHSAMQNNHPGFRRGKNGGMTMTPPVTPPLVAMTPPAAMLSPGSFTNQRFGNSMASNPHWMSNDQLSASITSTPPMTPIKTAIKAPTSPMTPWRHDPYGYRALPAGEAPVFN